MVKTKRHDGVDVTAIYEALAHRRAANYDYVLVHLPESVEDVAAVTIEELAHEAEEHGIGLVQLSEASDYKGSFCRKQIATTQVPRT